MAGYRARWRPHRGVRKELQGRRGARLGEDSAESFAITLSVVK